MAKKEKVEQEEEGIPAWLVTFSDMMTLLLTFFVLLLSMASLKDEQKVKRAIGSLAGSFGLGPTGIVPFEEPHGKVGAEPGPLEDVKDFQSLKPMLWDEKKWDIDLMSNKFIQILELGPEVLFSPGSSKLTQQGKLLLAKLVPILKKIKYPIELRGHTASLRDEFGPDYMLQQQKSKLDLSWKLSLARTLAVYRFFLDAGVKPEKIRLEAFGRFRPRYANTTSKGRQRNRRVELVLDKRISSWAVQEIIKFKVKTKIKRDKFIYKDFIFDLNGTSLEK
ncbi:MAG: OmpA family protein [Desulfonauticus sp.]|nr:OmpA family protein [Desulfonauticus sp.]